MLEELTQEYLVPWNPQDSAYDQSASVEKFHTLTTSVSKMTKFPDSKLIFLHRKILNNNVPIFSIHTQTRINFSEGKQ